MSQPEMEPEEVPETQVVPETQSAAPGHTEAEAQPEASPEEAQPEASSEDQTVAVSFSAEEILGEPAEETDAPVSVADAQLLAVLEAIIYVTDEPLTLEQIAEAT